MLGITYYPIIGAVRERESLSTKEIMNKRPADVLSSK